MNKSHGFKILIFFSTLILATLSQKKRLLLKPQYSERKLEESGSVSSVCESLGLSNCNTCDTDLGVCKICAVGYHQQVSQGECLNNNLNCFYFKQETKSCRVCRKGYVRVDQSFSTSACLKFERQARSPTKMLLFLVPYSIAVIFTLFLMCKHCKNHPVLKKYHERYSKWKQEQHRKKMMKKRVSSSKFIVTPII